MKQPTYEEYLANPSAVLERVERQARRERAQVVRQLIVVPLARVLKRKPALEPLTA